MSMTAAVSPTESSYDQVPYDSYPFRSSHPDLLATVATLLGMQPAPITRCRVLELGCAAGGNLIPMALALPESTFLGIDLSARQIGHGQTALAMLGLKNIELRHASITDISADWGPFDYIICHGVYSWVPKMVQDKILAVCKENLAPQGVAYVSYNTYPGWHMKEMLRRMMCYHAQRFGDPLLRVRQARSLLDFLAQTTPQNSAYGLLLRGAVDELRQSSDTYLLHEFLEEVNEPVYFHEFVDKARAKGLQYLGEASIGVMAACNFPPEVQQKLYQLSSNDIEIEQFMDFVRNRTFRQTLLCHAEIDRQPELKPATVARLYVTSSAQPANPQLDVRSTAMDTFRTAGHTLTTAEPLVKAALVYLARQAPLPVPFEEVRKAARSAIGLEDPADPAVAARDTQVLGQAFLQCYLTSDLTELHSYQPPFVVTVSERPLASPLARLQAPLSDKVTNLRHETVTMDIFGRFLLPLLNGARTRAEVVGALVDLGRRGSLQLSQNGKPITDPEEMRPRFDALLAEALPRLARLALLVG